MDSRQESRKFFYKFGKLFYNIDAYYSEFAKNSEVKPNLLWILYALDDKQLHSQKEISKSWDIPLSTINTIIIDLHNNGYVDLVQIPKKKREMQIKLTEKGVEFSNNILKGIYDIEEKVFLALNEKIRIIDDLEFMLNQLKDNRGD